MALLQFEVVGSLPDVLQRTFEQNLEVPPLKGEDILLEHAGSNCVYVFNVVNRTHVWSIRGCTVNYLITLTGRLPVESFTRG